MADELAEAERALGEETEAVETRWGGDETPAGDPAAEVRGELGGLRSALERSAGELRRLEARLEVIAQRSSRLESEASRLRAATAEAIERAPELAKAAHDAREAEQAAEQALTAAAELRRAADAEHHRWMAREEALSQALTQSRARAGAERLSGVGGVVGTLMELVEIDGGFESAFEAAAGEVLAAVVVDGLAAARRGLDELHRHGTAGAVVALPDIEAKRVPAAVVSGAEPLRGRVRALLPGVEALLDQLLGSSVVVDGSWSAAVDVAIAHPELVVVTTNGDRFSGGLWRAGAGGAGATAAAVDEARRQVEAAAARVSQAEADHARALREADAARQAASAASKAVETGDARRRAAEEGLRRSEDELAEARSELEAARAQRVDLEERLSRERDRVSELESILPALEQAAEAEAERAAAERAARARLAERSAAVAAMRRDLEVRAAGLEERKNLTERRLREVEERLRRNVTEREEAQTRRLNLERALEVTGRLLAFVLERESVIASTVARLREARRVQVEADRERTERLEQLRRQRSAAERQLAETRERISRADLDDTEARVRLEAITETIRRDLDCEPDAIRGTECPELPPGTSATSRRAELERELRLMGPINPLALEEHTALMERHDFLEAQLEDVRRARRELTKVIKAIDAEIVEVFRAAYADVADNFERLFSTLFPGGQGRLRLTDPDHLLETGIEVEARPSGKNVRRLSLLSGGERSLTALAFLFAVFRSRPSPFYMMDEVEAALDDVNLHRFLDLVHEFRDEAQLLVVSHQKRTMEAADALYGVTMTPGGSSKVVSQKVRRAAPEEATAALG
jgi:chromosome segregation protein